MRVVPLTATFYPNVPFNVISTGNERMKELAKMGIRGEVQDRFYQVNVDVRQVVEDIVKKVDREGRQDLAKSDVWLLKSVASSMPNRPSQRIRNGEVFPALLCVLSAYPEGPSAFIAHLHPIVRQSPQEVPAWCLHLLVRAFANRYFMRAAHQRKKVLTEISN